MQGVRAASWLLAMLVLLNSIATHAAVRARRAPADASGAPVDLPYRAGGILESGCIEVRAHERGSDISLALRIGDRRIPGDDGGIGRHGLQWLVHCGGAPESYELRIESADKGPPAAPLLSLRTLGEDSGSRSALSTLSSAFDALADPARADDAAVRFADSAAGLDDAGDRERAGIAWMLAAQHAQAALDRPLAARAFDAARAHAHESRRTRAEVVLLNDRALFLQASEPLEARQLIEQANRLQAQVGDPRLAAFIENNVCLLRHQYGDLEAAESCFAHVLETSEKIKAGPALVGAARNNLALADLSRGHYAAAEKAFRRAAAERLEGGDKSGHVLSRANLALALYYRGDLEGALRELHAAYATAGGDEVGRARVAAFLAAMYLAWGDTVSASAFASEAEATFRRHRVAAELAPTLRLRAHIEADRGHLDAALEVVREAWQLADAGEQRQAAANIAGVYVDILLRRGELDSAAQFIRDARSHFATHAEAHDLLSLRAAELRLMRLRGDRGAARALAARLLGEANYPGIMRTAILVERYLADVAPEHCAHCDGAYRALLDEIGRGVAASADAALAVRVLDLVRPAAEATIASTLAQCERSECAASALHQAAEFFALEPRGAPGAQAGVDPELRGLLQSLSKLEAEGDLSAAPEQLKRRLAQLQAAARLQQRPSAAPPCAPCRQLDRGDIDLVYFFGDARSWRWQRDGAGWRVRELPAWNAIAAQLQAQGDPQRRRAALAALSGLVADLPRSAATELAVGGDPRIGQIPFAALSLGDGGVVLDRYAVSVRVSSSPAAEPALPRAEFWANASSGPTALPMIATEQRTVSEWSRRAGLSFAAEDSGAGARVALLHISAHGERDIGSGSAVLWLADRPVLSFVLGEHVTADTVVINACESGAAPEHEPSQASIAAAFLRGGARQVVATLFPVGDHAAATFTETFYATFDPARNNLAGAVREAQLALRSIPSAGNAWASYVALVAHN